MTHTEEFKVDGKDLVDRIKAVIQEGNVRRVSVRNKSGKTILELPLNYGVVGALLAPQAAAIGAIAALLTSCSIVVERELPGETDSKAKK